MLNSSSHHRRSSSERLEFRRQPSHSMLPGKSYDEDVLNFYRRRRSFSEDGMNVAASTVTTNDSESNRRRISVASTTRRKKQSRIYDDPSVIRAYGSVPMLNVDRLPRGGVSIETSAVGRIQFGIPPETIKDSMRLGFEVPRIYIVPVDRFCREVGPALGINLAEFEFPAYFNFFIRRKKCTLVVDSEEAERSIRTVFEETLLGPADFRNSKTMKKWDDEDFDPSFPTEDRPDFYKEFRHFRIPEDAPNAKELNIDALVEFRHFDKEVDLLAASSHHDTEQDKNAQIGIPPLIDLSEEEDDNEEVNRLHSSLANGMDVSGHSLKGNMIERSLSADDPCLPPPMLARAKTDFASFVPHRPSDEGRYSSIDSLDEDILGSLMSAGAAMGDEGDPKRSWMFSQVKWLGDVATVWPADATPEQIALRSVPRVEIFKMPGAEYIIHEVDVNNYITGKACISGTVEVPDEIAVQGFLTSDAMTSRARVAGDPVTSIDRPLSPPGFHPPSFGVTILGNSHGFDKNGSTSGYVIWINGRGVMVDPPPYSSATLEREGIRPQTIIAIIITHCHADHDAGAFQKVLTGSRVAIITTPTIYKSFIRKYSALSGLSPRFLRHSHRFRPAIIGQPLRFQGATFHFLYTLHTIPCIALRVDWRGRSVVFTGDHLNEPTLIARLQDSGVFSPGRANSLNQLPLQDCDVLLHEAGAPPIHTPLTVLQKLAAEVKERLYVVHTSALPPDCGLRVAPVGTAGTIRLDERRPRSFSTRVPDCAREPEVATSALGALSAVTLDDGGNTNLSVHGDYVVPSTAQLKAAGLADKRIPPLVFQRPTCVSDAWFILNLLSNIPFFSSLSYLNTMEVLEIARIEVFCVGDVVVSAKQRGDILCVVWEGICAEKNDNAVDSLLGDNSEQEVKRWHAGDWLGPVSLQPSDQVSNGLEAQKERPKQDVYAASEGGVKVIQLQMNELEKILRRGSKLYRKYLQVLRRHAADEAAGKRRSDSASNAPESVAMPFFSYDHILNVLRCNSVLGKLPPLQKRYLESIAEGPRAFEAGAALWRAGTRCEYSYLIVAGSARFDTNPVPFSRSRSMTMTQGRRGSIDIGNGRFIDADRLLKHVPPDSEFARLEQVLASRSDHLAEGKNGLSDTRLVPKKDNDQTKLAQDRFANRILAKLYAAGKFTSGLTFGRGCFLSDTSRMVAGELVQESGDGSSQAVDSQQYHSATMIAGPEGCVVLVFPRSTFVPFLDANPGMLLCLLGTQVVV